MKLDLHPTVFIAVNLFPGWTSDPRRLANEQRRARDQRWTIEHVPGNGAEAVAVALGEAVLWLDIAADGLFQHLRLLAFVLHTEQQPQGVTGRTRVLAQREKMPAAQVRLITFAFGQLVVSAVPLQGLAGQLAAAPLTVDQQWRTVVLQRRVEFRTELSFQQQAGAGEVIIAAGDLAGPGAETLAEMPHHRMIGHLATALLVRRGPEGRKESLIVSEDKMMPLWAVLMVPGDALLTAQALDELKITFPVLGAVFACWAAADMKGIGIGQNAVALEDLSNDLRDRQLLKDPLLVTELQVMQGRDQCQVITSQAWTGVAHPHIFDAAMQTFAIEAKLKKRRLTEQAFQIDIGALADQLQLQRIQAAESLTAVKRQHFKIMAHRGDQQVELRGIGRSEHKRVLGGK